MNSRSTDLDPDYLSRPIRELGLSVEGSRLGPIVGAFLDELDRRKITRVRPRFYLSTEWGVPDGTVAIAIPFYLASEPLARLHESRAGHVEGRDRRDILRYLRHEMGHVINYAYRLFETAEWERLFGPITLPYLDEYHPEPFSRDFVRHLPGWYAQKHPDEDWAETFAVWMTPGLDWRLAYADRPGALAKLEYCDRVMAALIDRDPIVVADDLDEDVSEIDDSIDDYYEGLEAPGGAAPAGLDLDPALRSIFEDIGEPDPESGVPVAAPRRLASALIEGHSAAIAAEVYRWTGLFPERTRPLLRSLADRADALGQVYPEPAEVAMLIALTALVTAMASDHVARGRSPGVAGS